MKKSIIFVSLFILVLFSVGVLAQTTNVPTPAEAFSKLGGFFSGLFTGGASWENAYLLTFLLYFILFLAIFVEGLKYLPFFGGKGEINTPGKWFAFAAAMLSTLGLFVTEQVLGRSTLSSISILTAPFGFWGAFVLAALIAMISYKGIRDSGIVGDSHLAPIAIAAAAGLTIAGWLLSPAIMSWGFFLLLLLIVGMLTRMLFNFFSRSRAEKKAAAEEQLKEKAADAAETTKAGRVATPIKSGKAKKIAAAEAAEESFTISEFEKIKSVRQRLEKVFELIRQQGSKAADKRNFTVLLREVDTAIIGMSEVEDLGRKAWRIGRKLRRKLPKTAKKGELRILADIQAINEEVKRVIKHLRKREEELKGIVAGTRAMLVPPLMEEIESMKKIEQWIAALIELEKQMKEEIILLTKKKK